MDGRGGLRYAAGTATRWGPGLILRAPVTTSSSMGRRDSRLLLCHESAPASSGRGNHRRRLHGRTAPPEDLPYLSPAVCDLCRLRPRPGVLLGRLSPGGPSAQCRGREGSPPGQPRGPPGSPRPPARVSRPPPRDGSDFLRARVRRDTPCHRCARGAAAPRHTVLRGLRSDQPLGGAARVAAPARLEEGAR